MEKNVLEHEPGIALFVFDAEELEFAYFIRRICLFCPQPRRCIILRNQSYLRKKKQGKCWKDWILKLIGC